MRSDWDDAPGYLKARKRSGEFGKWVIAGLIGTSITGGLLLWADSHMRIPLFHSTPTPIAKTAPSDYQPAYEFEEVPEPARTPEQIFWESVAKRDSQHPPARQTDYNDHNYTPRGAENVVSSESLRNSSAYQRASEPAQSASYSRSVEHEGHWIDKWSGGARYYAEWTAVNNYIESTSVCANHKRGSIDYRECRKGAKQYFHEQCKAWRERYEADRKDQSELMRQRYCSAASSFSPMG